MSRVHFFRVVERPGRGTLTTTLCGRMSGKGADGINSTEKPAEVTCKFCLRRLAEKRS